MSNADTKIMNLWDRHLETEFAMRSPEEALKTMADDPRVTIVPTLIGGRGREEIGHFYGHHFLNQLPPDLEVVPVSRTIGEHRIVDELVVRFTHTIRMDWVLPCIEPTGKRIEFAMVVVVYVKDDKIEAENLYWDNATILRQAGLLPNPKLPVLGAESAQQILDPRAPHNELLKCT